MNPEEKGKVFEYLNKNKSENALLLYDLENLYPKVVDFFLALDHYENVKGLYLSWFEVPSCPSVHLRADNNEIASRLIRRIRYKNNFRIVSPRVYSENIEERFGNYVRRDYLCFMVLNLQNLKTHYPIFETRRLSSKDVLQVKKLFKDAAETDKGLEKWVLSSLDKEIFFGCFEDDTLCSIAGTLFRYNDFAMIGNVFTKKEYRRRGFATNVLLALINFLSEKNFKEAQLYVVEGSPAHKLYKKLGFEERKEYVRYLV